MSDHGLGGVFSPSEDEGEKQDPGSKGATDFEIPLASDQLNAWFDNAPSFSTNSKEAHEGYAIALDDRSTFDGPSSLPSGQMTGEVPCLVGGQSSGTKKMDASDSLEMQTKETTLQEDGEKETIDGCKPQKRTRCAEIHNLNERIRRQKLKEKMKVLRELIPNCNKRDKSSTLDDAINYIKSLQYQLQMVSTGVGHSPSAMMLQVNFPPLLQTAPPRGGIGMGIPNMPPPALLYPNHYEPLEYPCLMPPALPRPAQNPAGDLLESSYASSFPSSGSQSLLRGDASSSPQGDK